MGVSLGGGDGEDDDDDGSDDDERGELKTEGRNDRTYTLSTIATEKLLSRCDTTYLSCLRTYLGSNSFMSGSLLCLNGYEVAGGN